jgi:3-oxoacyl-[acyl-carrier protein] reductase
MRGLKWGRIINLSSFAAQTGGVVGVHYASSKAGMLGTRYYAKYLAAEGITVNSIAPALIETDMVAANPNATAAHIPVSRFGTVDEVAQVAANAGGQRLHQRADHQREWRLVHELTLC